MGTSTKEMPCKKLRGIQNSFDFGTPDSLFIKRAKAAKDAVKDLLLNGVPVADIGKKITEEFETFGYKSPVECQRNADDITKYVIRLYDAEQERKLKKFSPSYKSVEVGGIYVRTGCDYATYTPGDEKTPYELEFIKVKVSRPKIGAKIVAEGRYEALELYFLLKYAETFVKTKGNCRVTASLYYLRRKDDKNAKFDGTGEVFNKFFDANGANVVSISESFEDGEKVTYKVDRRGNVKDLPDWDKTFAESLAKYREGIEPSKCDPKKCSETCPLYNACKPVMPPLKIAAPKKLGKAKRAMPTATQKQAINADKGIFRLLAGAGSGKTFVIQRRVIALLDKGVEPEKILCITFTNSGAEEMRTRIARGLKANGLSVKPEDLNICTFNGWCMKIIEKEYAKLGFTSSPKVIDEIELHGIITRLLNSVPEIPGLDYRNFTSTMTKGALIVAKEAFAEIKKNDFSIAFSAELRDALLSKGIHITDATAKELIVLYDKFNDAMRAENLIQFDDQIHMIDEIRFKEPFYFRTFGYEHIIVDEFQDTDAPQLELLKALIDCPSFKSLMVVGDDSQAIFGFRNTSPEFIIDFEDKIGKKVTDIPLIQNFRSSPQIIEFANRINDKNIRKVAKSLVSVNKDNCPVTVMGFFGKNDEYDYIVHRMKYCLEHGYKPEQIAFIAYSKTELKNMASRLAEEGIPSVMMNPEPIAKNCSVIAANALLKFIKNPADKASLLSYACAAFDGNLLGQPARTINRVCGEIERKVRMVCSLPDIPGKDELIKMLKAIDKYDDELYQAYLKTLAFKPNIDKIAEYVSDFELFGEKAEMRREMNYPGVQLTTSHTSKGCEYPVVFNSISNYYDERICGNPDAIEERRRLLFVSATRAMEQLYVTGNWVSYSKEDEVSKIKSNYYNKFLKDAFDAIDQKVTNATIEDMNMVHKDIEALKKASVKKTSKKTVESEEVHAKHALKRKKLHGKPVRLYWAQMKNRKGRLLAFA